jgi:hypothetical protein
MTRTVRQDAGTLRAATRAFWHSMAEALRLPQIVGWLNGRLAR